MFDAKTVREELAVIEDKIKTNKPVDRDYAVKCVRWLHGLERREAEQDMPRNPMTGY